MTLSSPTHPKRHDSWSWASWTLTHWTSHSRYADWWRGTNASASRAAGPALNAPWPVCCLCRACSRCSPKSRGWTPSPVGWPHRANAGSVLPARPLVSPVAFSIIFLIVQSVLMFMLIAMFMFIAMLIILIPSLCFCFYYRCMWFATCFTIDFIFISTTSTILPKPFVSFFVLKDSLLSNVSSFSLKFAYQNQKHCCSN